MTERAPLLGPHPVVLVGSVETCPECLRPAPSTQAPRRFLLELERRMEENIVISDVCDIVYRYAANHFSVYITYVSNQTYQERTYKQLL